MSEKWSVIVTSEHQFTLELMGFGRFATVEYYGNEPIDNVAALISRAPELRDALYDLFVEAENMHDTRNDRLVYQEGGKAEKEDASLPAARDLLDDVLTIDEQEDRWEQRRLRRSGV